LVTQPRPTTLDLWPWPARFDLWPRQTLLDHWPEPTLLVIHLVLAWLSIWLELAWLDIWPFRPRLPWFFGLGWLNWILPPETTRLNLWRADLGQPSTRVDLFWASNWLILEWSVSDSAQTLSTLIDLDTTWPKPNLNDYLTWSWPNPIYLNLRPTRINRPMGWP